MTQALTLRVTVPLVLCMEMFLTEHISALENRRLWNQMAPWPTENYTSRYTESIIKNKPIPYPGIYVVKSILTIHRVKGECSSLISFNCSCNLLCLDYEECCGYREVEVTGELVYCRCKGIFRYTFNDVYTEYKLTVGNTSSSCYVVHTRYEYGGEYLPRDKTSTVEYIDRCSNESTLLNFGFDIGQACEEVNDNVYVISDVQKTSIIFKNIFCVLCTMNTYRRLYACNIAAMVSSYNVGDWLRLTQNNTSECKNYEWMSPNKGCFQKFCSGGKHFLPKCSLEIIMISEDSLKLRMFLIPQSARPIALSEEASMKVLQNLINVISSKIHSSLDDKKIPMTTELVAVMDSSNSTGEVLLYVWLRVLFKFSFKSTKTDEIGSTLINTLMKDLLLQLDNNISISFLPYIPIQDFNYTETCNDGQNFKCRRIVSSNMNSSVVFKTKLLNRCTFGYYIILNQVYYTIHTDSTAQSPNVVVTVDLKGMVANISDYNELSMLTLGSKGLQICTELLNTKFKHIKGLIQISTLPSTMKSAKDVVMKTVMILSGACLTLTLVTYAIFPELRSEAGKTNIMLCVSLLLATVTVMVKSYIPKLGIICTTMGVASHFVWLWMLMWMFLGTFQSFKIFSASTRNLDSDPYQNHLLMRKLVISFLPPSVIVGAVIVKSLIESDGDVIGYGLNGCFIDSKSSVVMFLIAPVVVATVVNSGLFVATTYNIHKVRRVQASDFTQRTHGMVLVYVKLSTLTGISFVLDFIAFMLHSDVIGIISILLTGLQGVFIFLSLTCNKRVLDLYVKLCRGKLETPPGISSPTTASTATVADTT